MNAIPLTQERVLKKTLSRCPACRKLKPAQVIEVGNGPIKQVIMRRVCSCHGTQDAVISSDSRFYWLAQGDPSNSGGCGCGPGSACSVGGGTDGSLGKNAGSPSNVIEQLSTCLALIEIVDSCNLACPTCFADSPVGVVGAKLKYRTFDELTTRIQNVIDRKGRIEVLQFSGGEPTLHPEFFRLVDWVRTNPGIDYLLINTNGVRLAKDSEFVEQMRVAVETHHKIQLYLQFDGPQAAGQVELRGTDLREMRESAIRNCERIGLPITLAMTVNADTVAHVWDTVMFALPFNNIRGVSFQPEFLSGRNPNRDVSAIRINTADVILGLHEQSGGQVAFEDFTPLPCGDPNCATISWLFRAGGRYHSPSTFGIDIPKLQESLPDRVNYRLEDLRKCGCENTPLGNLMKDMEVKESNAFRILIKPFMDAWSWDQDRIDRCCTHVIGPDGRLHSFCEYYFGPVAEASCC